MANKLSLKFIKSNFSDFISKLQDLASIEDVIKLKIENDTILMYSMISNEVSVLALKNYIVNTSDYIENFTSEETFDFIITSAGKFVKNLKFFNVDSPIKLDIIYKPLPEDDTINHVRSAQFSNGKLKISCVGGEEYKIKDITKNVLKQKLNPKNSQWSFKISKEDFGNIKKLCSINSEDKIVNINVNGGKVTLSEMGKWELEVDTIDSKNANLIFGKKYLSNINDDDDFINFQVFTTFILAVDNTSNFMLSFEQTFEDED